MCIDLKSQNAQLVLVEKKNLQTMFQYIFFKLFLIDSFKI